MTERPKDPAFEDLLDLCQSRVFRFLLPTLGHSLRAPLNGMIINLELLKELLKPEVEANEQLLARRERTVAAIGRTVTQLRLQVESLLVEGGLMRTDPGPFDLRDLVHESVAILRPQAVVQRVMLESEVPDIPARVSGRRDDLKKAFLAVAVNALEAMPSGGEMKIGLQRARESWVVSIADAGPGIAPDIAAKLGKLPFSTKNRSGIGLMVARKVAEAHGGSLDLDSATGSGTRARLLVPADQGR